MVEAKRVVLKPLNNPIQAGQDLDFAEYIKKKLLEVSVEQDKKFELMLLGHPLSLFVVKTEPQGKVTVTENTQLQIVNEIVMRGDVHYLVKSGHAMREPNWQTWVPQLNNQAQRLDVVSKRLEITIRSLNLKFDTINLGFNTILLRLDELEKKLSSEQNKQSERSSNE